MEDFMDSTFKKDMVVLEVSRKIARIYNNTLNMPDLEMVINEEENGCRFEDKRKENWIHM